MLLAGVTASLGTAVKRLLEIVEGSQGALLVQAVEAREHLVARKTVPIIATGKR